MLESNLISGYPVNENHFNVCELSHSNQLKLSLDIKTPQSKQRIKAFLAPSSQQNTNKYSTNAIR